MDRTGHQCIDDSNAAVQKSVNALLKKEIERLALENRELQLHCLQLTQASQQYREKIHAALSRSPSTALREDSVRFETDAEETISRVLVSAKKSLLRSEALDSDNHRQGDNGVEAIDMKDSPASSRSPSAVALHTSQHHSPEHTAATEKAKEKRFFDVLMSEGHRNAAAKDAVTVHDIIAENIVLREQLESERSESLFWRRRAMDTEVTSRGAPGGSEDIPNQSFASVKLSSPVVQNRSMILRDRPLREEAALTALRRRYAAVLGRLTQQEETSKRELSHRDTIVSSLMTQLEESRQSQSSLEGDCREKERLNLELQRENVSIKAAQSKLEARLATLEAERRIFVATAERLHSVKSKHQFEADITNSQSIEAEMTRLKDAVDDLSKRLETAESENHLLTVQCTGLTRSKEALQEAFDRSQQLLLRRSASQWQGHEGSEGNCASSVGEVIQRLEGVVARAEATALQSAQGGVLALAQKVHVAESLTKSADRYAALLRVKERQLNVILEEIGNCEKVGWPMTVRDAQLRLLEVTTEGGMLPAPPREEVLRSRQGWREMRDVRTNAVFYVTKNIGDTPFAPKEVQRNAGK